MTRMLKSSWGCALFALLLSIAVPTLKVSAQDYDERDDPPTRVARLGYIEGAVSFQPAGVDDWVQAVPNRPMTTGDQLWTDRDSRAELQLGSALIRLSENTGFSFLNLDDHAVQIQLSSGSISVRMRRLDHDDYFEVDTPNLAFTVSQPGSYRLDVGNDGLKTIIGVRDGAGQATGGGQSYPVYSGQRGEFWGADSLYANVGGLGDRDQFDNWAFDRDRRYDGSRSASYLPPDVVGFQDLDDNGDWRDDPNNGHVWFPRVDAGWAPYHNGHWDWIDPWGYTWVDDSPWGYAPFHYGRWVSVSGRWGWVAGPMSVRPVYAPALVVFIGGGGRELGGNVAWFPLGPREVYVPPYQVSRGYMNQVNVSSTVVNTTTITNVYNTTIINKTTTITNITYANRVVPGAVVAVPRDAFAGAKPVAHIAVPLNAQQIAGASVSQRVAVAPTHQSVVGANAATVGHVTKPPAAIMTRQVVAAHTPPPPPVSFAAKQQMMAAHPGQPLAKTELRTLPPAPVSAQRPAVKVAPPSKPATPAMAAPGNAPNAPHVPPANQPGNIPSATPATPNRTPAGGQNPQVTPPPNRPAPNSPQTRPSQPVPPVAPTKPAPQTPQTVHPPTQPSPAAKPVQPPPPAYRPPVQPTPAPPAAKPVPPPPPPPQRPVQPPPPAAKPVPPAPPPKAKPQAPEKKKEEGDPKKN